MEVTSLNCFGFPLMQRIEEIAKKTQSPESRYTIEIMGRRQHIPVISVRIEFPVYRLANGRTRSAQLEYFTQHKDAPSDLFTRDNDSFDAQKAQHEILTQLVRDEDLLANFQSGELEQVDPILCTNTGVVVNGNRRLCAWRMLYYSDSVKYKSFETVQIAILPEMDEKGIVDLEKKLQILKTMRAEYRWHTKALMAEMDLQKGQKDSDVARSFDLSKKKLLELIEARRLAKLYLEQIGHPDEWSRLDKSQYAFESIVTGGKKILDTNLKELFQKLAFNLITTNLESIDGGANDRLYNLIKDYAENIEAIADELAQKMKEPEDSPSPKIDESGTASPETNNTEDIDTSNPSNEIVEDGEVEDDAATLLSGGEVSTPDSAGIVSTAIEKGAEIQHDKIGEIIDARKALKNEKDKSQFFIKELSKVVSSLDFAINNGLDENTNTEGIPAQLEELQKRIDKIKNWIANKQ